MFDFAALPPEVNSGLMYSGPGSAPMVGAASAWASLAGELHTVGAAYEAVIAALTDGSWLGPAAASMAASSQAQVEWLNSTAVQAEQVAAQASAAVSAYEAAFIATVPPPEIAANRALLMQLIATNLLGQNTPAILATEAMYAEMWAQDAAAMYGYAGASAAASTLAPFAPTAESANPAGLGAQAAAVSQAVGSSAGTDVTNALAAAAAPAAPGDLTLEQLLAQLGLTGTLPNSNGDGLVLNGVWGDIVEGLTGSQTVDGSTPFDTFIRLISPFRLSTTASKDIEGLAEAATKFGGAAKVSAVEAIPAALPPPSLPSGISGAGALGGLGKAELVGKLSVPPAWGGVNPSVSPAVTPVGNLGTPVSSQPLTPVANSMGAPPVMAGTGGRGMQFAAPRYGFKPTVVARPFVGG
ncbi:PPE family protein [Candidatus Mycobacterium wuenschmannii]|uniref:PPE family protein n=1 Tax=Candidatus Mycobacterium wuenschmannii TaxID=3027808 RepID=A0ABY8VU99_9MYCO|nr:PPE family protein [Candidatus Mycobacterium wuenschmannii]WIM86369.1 PPE family protein [Candidatus Mycobacterium wuenschmannii]